MLRVEAKNPTQAAKKYTKIKCDNGKIGSGIYKTTIIRDTKYFTCRVFVLKILGISFIVAI